MLSDAELELLEELAASAGKPVATLAHDLVARSLRAIPRSGG